MNDEKKIHYLTDTVTATAKYKQCQTNVRKKLYIANRKIHTFYLKKKTKYTTK